MNTGFGQHNLALPERVEVTDSDSWEDNTVIVVDLDVHRDRPEDKTLDVQNNLQDKDSTACQDYQGPQHSVNRETITL